MRLLPMTGEGEKAVAYNEIIPVLIEAMKEQQNQIESANHENQKLRSEVQGLKKKMDKMEAMFANN
jgi:predicted RNase H-like nuclease (RuvC/YqgF family)